MTPTPEGKNVTRPRTLHDHPHCQHPDCDLPSTEAADGKAYCRRHYTTKILGRNVRRK